MAHAVWLSDQEIDILKRHDVKIVHNPSSNMKLGKRAAHVKQMLNEGLVVGLGARIASMPGRSILFLSR